MEITLADIDLGRKEHHHDHVLFSHSNPIRNAHRNIHVAISYIIIIMHTCSYTYLSIKKICGYILSYIYAGGDGDDDFI